VSAAAGRGLIPDDGTPPPGVRHRGLGVLFASVPRRAGPGDDVAQHGLDPLRLRVAGQHLGLVAFRRREFGGVRLPVRGEGNADDAPDP
jgi:hypothetical protein